MGRTRRDVVMAGLGRVLRRERPETRIVLSEPYGSRVECRWPGVDLQARARR
jgi:cysteine synthase